MGGRNDGMGGRNDGMGPDESGVLQQLVTPVPDPSSRTRSGTGMTDPGSMSKGGRFPEAFGSAYQNVILRISKGSIANFRPFPAVFPTADSSLRSE
jgi:hypothetical protein